MTRLSLWSHLSVALIILCAGILLNVRPSLCTGGAGTKDMSFPPDGIPRSDHTTGTSDRIIKPDIPDGESVLDPRPVTPDPRKTAEPFGDKIPPSDLPKLEEVTREIYHKLATPSVIDKRLKPELISEKEDNDGSWYPTKIAKRSDRNEVTPIIIGEIPKEIIGFGIEEVWVMHDASGRVVPVNLNHDRVDKTISILESLGNMTNNLQIVVQVLEKMGEWPDKSHFVRRLEKEFNVTGQINISVVIDKLDDVNRSLKVEIRVFTVKPEVGLPIGVLPIRDDKPLYSEPGIWDKPAVIPSQYHDVGGFTISKSDEMVFDSNNIHTLSPLVRIPASKADELIRIDRVKDDHSKSTLSNVTFPKSKEEIVHGEKVLYGDSVLLEQNQPGNDIIRSSSPRPGDTLLGGGEANDIQPSKYKQIQTVVNVQRVPLIEDNGGTEGLLKLEDLSPSFSGPSDSMRQFLEGIGGFGNQPGQAPPSVDLSSFSADELQFLPPETLLDFDSASLGEMAANFSSAQLSTVCESLLETDPDTAEQLMGSVDCAATFSHLSATRSSMMSGDMERAAVRAMRKNKPRDQWSTDEWSMAFLLNDGLEPDDLTAVPASVLFDNLATLSADAADLEAELADMVLNQVLGRAGNLAAINGSVLAAMGGMLNFLDAEDLHNIPAASKREALRHMKDMKLPDDVAAEFYDNVINDFDTPANWGTADLTSAAELIKYDVDILDELPIEAVVGSISSLGNKTMDGVEALGFSDRLLEAPGYSNAVAWNASTLASAKNLMASMPQTFIEDLPAEAILNAINSSSLASVPFSIAASRSILKKIREKIGGMSNLDGSMIAKLGTSLKSAVSSEVSQLNANAAITAIKTFSKSYNDMSDSTRAALLDKFKTQTVTPGGVTGSGIWSQLGDFFQELPIEDIDQLPYYEFNATYLQIAKPLTVTFTPAQAQRFMQNMELHYGPSSNFSMKMWTTLGGAVCGLSCDQIHALPDNPHFQSLVSHIGAHASCFMDSQARCMAERVREYLWGPTGPNVTLTNNATMDKVGAFLPYLDEVDLTAMPSSICKGVIKNLGKQSMDDLPRSSLIKLKKYALKCADKETSGMVMLTDVKYVGNVICGLEESDISRMETKFFTNRIRTLNEKCNLPRDMAKAIVEKTKTALNVSMPTITTGQLVKLGPSLVHFEDTELNKINETTLRKAAVRILNSFKRRSVMLKNRRMKGMTSDVTKFDVATREADYKKLFVRLATTFQNKRNTGRSSVTNVKRRRRRRSIAATSSLTCSDIMRLGEAVTGLTTEQLTLADAEFLNCAETLGKQTGLTDGQKRTLATVAMRSTVWGPLGSWTEARIITSGVIGQGLTPDELVLLPLSTHDMLSAMGAYTGWTTQQLSAVFGRWLDITQSGNPANIDSTELQSIREFACGATNTQISGIPVKSYKVAAATIGQLVSCDQSQLIAYASHARTSFNDVTSWDSSTITTVGTVVGGLSNSQLNGLTTSQIQSLSPTVIASMPPQSFVGFSAAQLGKLSTAQAQSVTASQQAALSSQQMAALQSAGAIVKGGGSGSGTEALDSNILGTVFVLLTLLAKAFMTI